MTREPRTVSTQIPANQALSGGIDIGDAEYIALEFSETSGISTITFQAKADRFNDEEMSPEDWDNVYDDAGNEVSVTVGANRVVVLGTATKAALCACRYIRVRSGTSGAPVNINPGIEIRFLLK